MTAPRPPTGDPVARDLGVGITQLRLPLPIPRLPLVNSYVFRRADGKLVIVDPGGGHDEGYEALRAGLAAMGSGPDDVGVVIATHLHPDHMGLCTRLVVEAGCDYIMHRSVADRLDGYNDWGPWRDRVVRLAGEHGAPAARLEAMAVAEPRPDWAPTSMAPTHLIDDGDKVDVGVDRWLRAVHTPGHDSSHICLLDSRTGALLSGDHVLPGITPFVPYPPEDRDNLGTYLVSLETVERLDPPVTYPAHHAVIDRGAARAKQIRLHHRRRLDGMLDHLGRGPATAWDIMESSFKPGLPALHARLAFQETLAHLEYLRIRNRVELVIGDDDVHRYVRPHR